MRKFVILCWMLMLAPPHSTLPAFADTDEPLVIKPAAGIDENLFLLRSLENIYAGWPRNSVDHFYLQAWFTQVRIQTTRLRASIKDRSLDTRIGNLYDDCLHLLDAHENYLANLGAIDRIAAQREQSDSGKVAETAIKMGLGAGSDAQRYGASDNQAAGVGILAGIIGGAVEDYQRTQARNEARREALEAEMRKVNAVWAETKSNAEIAAERLTKVHGWRPGEAGFDGFTSDKIGDYIRRRPRDPFLIVNIARIRV